jgi:hypothetical protein
MCRSVYTLVSATCVTVATVALSSQQVPATWWAVVNLSSKLCLPPENEVKWYEVRGTGWPSNRAGPAQSLSVETFQPEL